MANETYHFGTRKIRITDAGVIETDGEFCDFCLRPQVCGYYQVPAGKVLLGEMPDGRPVIDSAGQWNVCEECRALLQRRMWATLTNRVLGFHVLTTGLPPAHVRRQLLAKFNALALVWTGEFRAADEPCETDSGN